MLNAYCQPLLNFYLHVNKRSKWIYNAHMRTISKQFSPKKDNQNGRIPINACVISNTSVYCFFFFQYCVWLLWSIITQFVKNGCRVRRV